MLLLVLGLVLVKKWDGGIVLVSIGFMVFMYGFFVSLLGRGKHAVLATKIDKTHSWLVGVHPTVMNAVAAAPAPGLERFSDH